MHRPAQFIGTLAVALGAAALLLALPAWLRYGPVGLEGLVYAGVASFIPGVLLALLSRRFAGPQRAIRLLLMGTTLRVGFVLVMGLAVVQSRPVLRSPEFFLGLAVFYVIALAVETRQLLADVAPRASRETPVLSGSARQPQSN